MGDPRVGMGMMSRLRRLEGVLEARLRLGPAKSVVLAREVLTALPELTWYDTARRQCVIAEILIVRLTERLAKQAVVSLPPVGTTLVDALYAEAEALRSPPVSSSRTATSGAATDTTLGARPDWKPGGMHGRRRGMRGKPGGMPDKDPGGRARRAYTPGWWAGSDLFVRRLRDRADHLVRMGENRPRPAAGTWVRSEPAITEAAMRLTQAVAALPSLRERVTNVLIGRRGNTGPSKEVHLLADELLAVLPQPQDFQTTLERITSAGERLRDLRGQLAERRGGGGTTVDDRHWLNALAAELRKLADMSTAEAKADWFLSEDSFLVGFTVAGHTFAERLHARADEIAVPRRWTVWRDDTDRWTKPVEVAETDSEADAKAVVATMRHRGDQGAYQIDGWS